MFMSVAHILTICYRLCTPTRQNNVGIPDGRAVGDLVSRVKLMKLMKTMIKIFTKKVD